MSRWAYGELRPFLDITVEPEGGEALRVDLSSRVVSMNFIDEEKKADKLSITVENDEGDAWDTAIFAKGNILIVSFGYPGYKSPARRMVITKASGGVQMTVEAKDQSVLMHRKTISQTYEDLTRSEVVALIAERNGFGPAARVIEETTKVHETITQPNVSDARFLRALAHKQGFEFFVAPDGLHWHSRDLAQAPKRTFVYYPAKRAAGTEFANRNAIMNYTVENDLTAKPAKTTLKGTDPDTKQPIEVVGSDATTERDQLGAVVEVRDFETGAWRQVTRSASEETKPTAELDDDSAKDRADGRFRKISQRAVKLKFVTIGDPLLLAKTVCDVSGIAKRIDGRYYIKKVEHSISSSGYTCNVEAITDGTNGGTSLTDALFPSAANDGGNRVEAVLGALGNVVDFVTGAIENTARGSSNFLRDQAQDLGVKLTENPNDSRALEAAAALGKTLHVSELGSSLGSGARAVGEALTKASTIAGAQAKSAKGKGRRNTKPAADDTELAAKDGVDPEGREYREWE